MSHMVRGQSGEESLVFSLFPGCYILPSRQHDPQHQKRQEKNPKNLARVSDQ